MEHKLSPKGMILDICSMRSRAKKLLRLNPEYSNLLKVLTAKDYYNDEDLSIPSLKELAETANISYSVARRHLDKLYDDLCSYGLHEKVPFDFKRTEVRFGINGLYENVTFLASELGYIPRKGEVVQVRFFKEKTGTDYFHVDEIYHELSDNKHQIYISLRTGSYNSFWKLRRDQAEATGEISMHDAIMKRDFELKEQLDLKPSKAW